MIRMSKVSRDDDAACVLPIDTVLLIELSGQLSHKDTTCDLTLIHRGESERRSTLVIKAFASDTRADETLIGRRRMLQERNREKLTRLQEM